jgi:hypothetical protein
MRFPILVLSLTAALILPLATQAGINSMREPLFGSADAARERADALDARRLAPISYRDATENYQRADSTFERAGSVDTIRRYLSKAEQAYNKSVEAAEIARTALDATLQAREDALASEAYDYAEDDWEKGETNFASAARSLERGSIRSAERYAEKSESAYRSGELMAIKANYLTETKILIEQAEKLKAERYAPTSLNNARLLLQNAENGLNENRYDTDRPRSLATDAKHNALHAIYVSKLERSIRDRKASLESVLLTWEASIGRLGDALDTPVYFDDGETKAIDTLLEELELLKDREAGLAQQLADRDVELAALLQQTDKMQELLGGGNQTIEELEVLLAAGPSPGAVRNGGDAVRSHRSGCIPPGRYGHHPSGWSQLRQRCFPPGRTASAHSGHPRKGHQRVSGVLRGGGRSHRRVRVGRAESGVIPGPGRFGGPAPAGRHAHLSHPSLRRGLRGVPTGSQ